MTKYPLSVPCVKKGRCIAQGHVAVIFRYVIIVHDSARLFFEETKVSFSDLINLWVRCTFTSLRATKHDRFLFWCSFWIWFSKFTRLVWFPNEGNSDLCFGYKFI